MCDSGKVKSIDEPRPTLPSAAVNHQEMDGKITGVNSLLHQKLLHKILQLVPENTEFSQTCFSWTCFFFEYSRKK